MTPPSSISGGQLRLAMLLLLACSVSQAATETQGFLIPNAWLDATTSGDPLDPPDGVNWSFNDPWFFEANVFSGAALFITSANNQPGFYAAEASPSELTALADVQALDGYSPSTAILTDLIFSDPWRVGHFGSVPTTGEYNYFIEYTLETPAGFYRAATQKLDRAAAFENTIVQTDFEFTWQEDGFLGDPFAGGGGIALDQILGQSYNVLIEVITPTSDGDGFFNVEGFNVEYVVSTNVATPLEGDFNGDGAVDNGDLNLLLGAWGSSTAPPEWINGFDAPVDNDELNALLGGWGAGTAGAIPEPSSVLGLCVAMCGVVGSRSRRRWF